MPSEGTSVFSSTVCINNTDKIVGVPGLYVKSPYTKYDVIVKFFYCDTFFKHSYDACEPIFLGKKL